jgi:hypothetical protein
MRQLVVVLGVWCAAAGTASAADPALGSKFQTFCAEWMQKLAARERDNRARVKWQPGPDGVRGEFIGYSREHTCQLKESPDPKAVPIGKIIYRELQYRQAGPSVPEAQRSAPQPVEATEITEIFRYAAGKWVY